MYILLTYFYGGFQITFFPSFPFNESLLRANDLTALFLTLSYRGPFLGEKVTILLYTIIVKASTKINLQFFSFQKCR